MLELNSNLQLWHQYLQFLYQLFIKKDKLLLYYTSFHQTFKPNYYLIHYPQQIHFIINHILYLSILIQHKLRLIILIKLQLRIMNLPEIVEDDNTLKSELYELINQRYERNTDNKFNFMPAELQLIKTISSHQQLIQALQRLLKQFLTHKVQNSYCYFKLKSILKDSSKQPNIKINEIEQEINLFSKKQSDYNKINHLITMRDILLTKMKNREEVTSEVKQCIEDIRFVNEQIIKGIRHWKNQIKQAGVVDEIIIYTYKNQNYLTKIITDNQEIIDQLNFKAQIFLKSPNPFFIQVNQDIKGVSIKSLNSFLEILSEQKAQQLKMMIESPYIKSSKNTNLDQELKMLKNKLQQTKIDKLKTIYQTKRDDSNPFKKSNPYLHQEKINTITEKNINSLKNLQNLIKEKELQMLKELKKSRNVNLFNYKSQQREQDKRQTKITGFTSRVHNLRAQVQRNLLFAKQKSKKKERLPKVQAEIKAAKPKIKLISEKQITVENNVKNIFEMIMTGQQNKNKFNTSRSTFYKQIKIDESPTKQKQGEKKEKSRKKMIQSAVNFSSLKKSNSTGVLFRLTKNSANKGQNNSQVKDKDKSRQQELEEVKESMNILNAKIREQAIKNIYSNKNNKYKMPKQIKMITKEAQNSDLKIDKVQYNKHQIFIQNAPSYNFEEMIKQKQNNILKLKNKLQQMKESKGQINNEKIEEVDNKLKEIQQRKITIKQEREKVQLENIKIREQMKIQQMKYRELKDKEFKLREMEMQNKYKLELQKIKEELQAKNRTFQLKILQEQKKNKNIENQMIKLTKETEKIVNQLQEKQIKEQLYNEILWEENEKNKKQIHSLQSNDMVNDLIEQFKKQQEKSRLQLQRKAILSFQQEKLKLKSLYIQMHHKNKLLQQENLKKKQQLQKIYVQKQQDNKIIADLTKQMDQKQRKQVKNTINLEIYKVEQQKLTNETQQLQMLKKRLKEELMQEIKKKKKQEYEQEKIYQLQRQFYIQNMQEQMKKLMKIEEIELQKIQEEYRRKNDKIVDEYEQEIIKQKAIRQKINEQSQSKINNLKYQQPINMDKLINIDTGLQNYGKRLERKVSEISMGSKQSQNIDFFVQKTDKNQSSPQKHEKKQQQQQLLKNENQNDKKDPQQIEQIKPIQIPNTEQPLPQKQQQIKEGISKQQIKNLSSVVDNNIIVNTNESQINHERIISSQSKQQSKEIKKIEQTPSNLNQQVQQISQEVKQNRQEIKEKYDKLLQHVTKPLRQIFLTYQDIQTYINKFYSLLPQEIKEMLPYSRKQLQSIFREKKIDIFDQLTFGLYRPKEKKFILIGSIDCIPNIAQKYGEIQIEQVYLFNKSNNYQKQFLSKQIKIYEKIGYVFQKKTAQQNKYTIKFIVKIPKEVNKKQIHLQDKLEIKTTMIFQEHNQNDQLTSKRNCIYYSLAQGLAEKLIENQKIQLAGRSDVQSKFLNRRINQNAFNNTVFKTEKINHNVLQVTIGLPLKYIQTTEQPFYTLQVSQFEIKASSEKIYLASLKEHNLGIIIYKLDKIDIPEEFHLDLFIETKFKKMEKMSDVFIFLPVWQGHNQYKHKGNSPESYTYKEKTKANLVYGSILRSRVHKGDFMIIEPPFVFLIFEMSSQQVLRRILYGHIVQNEDIIRLKRSTN